MTKEQRTIYWRRPPVKEDDSAYSDAMADAGFMIRREFNLDK